MKLLSIQIGLPREISFNGKMISTGIFKQPVDGPAQVETFNILGDWQLSFSESPN
jgi:MOSC domain-containing protein YiiM